MTVIYLYVMILKSPLIFSNNKICFKLITFVNVYILKIHIKYIAGEKKNLKLFKNSTILC